MNSVVESSGSLVNDFIGSQQQLFGYAVLIANVLPVPLAQLVQGGAASFE